MKLNTKCTDKNGEEPTIKAIITINGLKFYEVYENNQRYCENELIKN